MVSAAAVSSTITTLLHLQRHAGYSSAQNVIALNALHGKPAQQQHDTTDAALKVLCPVLLLLLLVQTGCLPCPEGRITAYVPGDGSFQASLSDCKVPPGHGVYSADADDAFAPAVRTASLTVEKCPMGYFSEGDTAQGQRTRNPPCMKCPDNAYTSLPGQASCDSE
jgi:hypothetical protein